MKYVYYYFLTLGAQIVLIVILNILIHYKRITFHTGRWIATGVMTLSFIPASILVGWPFAIGVTVLMSIVTNYIYWGTEQMEIELAKKRLREEKAG